MIKLCFDSKCVFSAQAMIQVTMQDTKLMQVFPVSIKSQARSWQFLLWNFLCSGRVTDFKALFTSSPIDFRAKTVNGIPTSA